MVLIDQYHATLAAQHREQWIHFLTPFTFCLGLAISQAFTSSRKLLRIEVNQWNPISHSREICLTN